MSRSYFTLTAAREALASGQVSPLELAKESLRTIDRLEPQIQAWVDIHREDIFAQAEQIFKIPASQRGPLWGIPVGVKDIIDLAGYRTYCGSAMLRKWGQKLIAVEEEAPVVQRLRQAGALLLGKTATTEFACFDPAPTSNPWNLSHTPGGSSSGTAAAIASGMCFAALGTQTGGSILRPASYCGVVGYKPPFGSLPMRGIFPVSERLDHVGPFAASVQDAYFVQQVLAGATPNYSLPATSLKKWKLGVLYELFEPTLDTAEVPFFSALLQQIKAEGASVLPVQTGLDWKEVRAVHRQIMALDAWKVHSQHWPDRIHELGSTLQGLLEEGKTIASDGPQRDKSLSQKQKYYTEKLNQAFQDFDAVLLPATPAAAPATKTTTGDPQYNSPFSLTGLPAITVPYEVNSSGMPLGLQIVACQESSLWQVAATIEATFSLEGFAARNCPLK